MAGIYERLGIRPIINARGTHTRLGGSLMAPEVLEAMREAAGAYIVLDELQERASALIARATGAAAGMVTGGAAAGLLLGTAACIAGEDRAKIDRLPATTDMRDEIVMHRAHRNGYAHTDRTGAVVYLPAPGASPGALPLAQTCAIAHEQGVPVLVDAAAVLPPAENLTRVIAAGADLVVFSGGKGINGPQSSGILAGRADLIRAALLNGSPSHSIGRAAKAAKEDIVGLMVALERYLARDHAAELAAWRGQAEWMMRDLRDLPGVTATYRHDEREHHTPRVELTFDPATGIDASEVIAALEGHDPRIFLFAPTGPSARPNSVVINTHTMQPGEERIIGAALREALGERLQWGTGG